MVVTPEQHDKHSNPTDQWIWAERLFPGGAKEPLADHLIRISDGTITEIKPATNTDARTQIPRFPVVAPGFIDIQINGAGGVMFNDTPDASTILQMAQAASTGGTCHILPTFITAPGSAYEAALEAVAACNLANILGVHLEGPFLSRQRPGIHPPDAIRNMTKADIDLLTGQMAAEYTPQGKKLLLTVAPEEIDLAYLERLVEAGVIVFAGHSNATMEQLANATDRGLSGITHLFNACSQITARAPGIVGGALTDDRLFAGIIADGFHVAPRLLKLVAQMMAGRLCLVSDAMPTFASDITGFTIGDQNITLVDGRLQASDGTLGGAHLGLDQAVANMCQFADVSLAQALHMASGVPARILGLDDRYGQIAVGRPASITCLSDDLRCLDVFVHGNCQQPD